MAGCGGGHDTWTVDPEGYDGIGEETFGLLQNPCSISNGTMTLSVRTTETLYLTLRAADSMVIASASNGGAECAVPSTNKIVIAEDSQHPGGFEKVFLDYINGTFALGSTSGSTVTPGITIALGASSGLTVRGSSGVDKIYLGSTYTTGQSPALQYDWINVNGDTSPDVRVSPTVTDIKVSTGVGADIISADGNNGTTGTALDGTITFSAYGGPDADTLTGGKGPSLLNGGDGDDKFIQSATIGADTIVGGKGSDTVDYSVRTSAVNVTVCSQTSCDTTDVCGCVAADTSCRLAADGVKTGCDQTANGNKSSCDQTANTHKSQCDQTANGHKSQCDQTAGDHKATCDQSAGDAHTTCVNQCSDQNCIDGCDAQETADLLVCTNTLASDLQTCSNTLAGDLQTCSNTLAGDLQTCSQTLAGDLQTCTTTRNNSYNTCDGTQSTCVAACTRPLCAVCIGDDGTGSEGDTINDDVEVVLGSKGNDTISAQYAVCSDQASPTPVVKCTLKGNEGDDTLIGSSHVDLIDGGAGNDYLQGGLGDDTLIGGAGVDTVSYSDRTVQVKVSLDSAHLWVTGQNGQAGENDSIATDIENLTGGTGNDFLRGNANANIIHGGAGGDTIEGGAGNDSLYGEGGNDFLYGGAGNDMLIGGAGADTMYGGDGDDFLDSTDSPAAADSVIECDGVNDSANTPGTAPGTTDALVKDAIVESAPSSCEL